MCFLNETAYKIADVLDTTALYSRAMIVNIGGKLDSTYMHVPLVLYLTVDVNKFAHDTFYFQ